jgi:hypothetical protein
MTITTPHIKKFNLFCLKLFCNKISNTYDSILFFCKIMRLLYDFITTWWIITKC